MNTNYEELKSELSEQLQKYKNIVVTEDSIKEFKADKANLNRLKTALEDKRKEVKSNAYSLMRILKKYQRTDCTYRRAYQSN